MTTLFWSVSEEHMLVLFSHLRISFRYLYYSCPCQFSPRIKFSCKSYSFRHDWGIFRNFLIVLILIEYTSMSDGLLLPSEPLLVCCEYDVPLTAWAALLPGERQYGKCYLRKNYVQHAARKSPYFQSSRDYRYRLFLMTHLVMNFCKIIFNATCNSVFWILLLCATSLQGFVALVLVLLGYKTCHCVLFISRHF